MASTDSLLITLSSALGVGVTLLLNVVLLVVALTIVRKANGTASGLLAGSAGLSLITAILSPLAHMGVSRTYAVEDTLAIYAGLGLAFTLVRAAGFVLLIVGIAKLAAGNASDRHISPLIPH